MKKLFASLLISVLALVIVASAVSASAVFPSTNDANKAKSPTAWAHIEVVDEGISNGVGWVTLEFVSQRNFWSCFEYRTDGDTSQAIGSTNHNAEVLDGLYPFACVKNGTSQITLSASEFVEVRMAFGAEKDERFDWTKFDVPPGPKTIADCQKGGWQTYGFSNQGLCIKFVNTGK